MCEVPGPASSPTLVICRLAGEGHSAGCAVVSHGGWFAFPRWPVTSSISRSVGGTAGRCSRCGRLYRGSSKKLKIDLLHDPEISLPAIRLKKSKTLIGKDVCPPRAPPHDSQQPGRGNPRSARQQWGTEKSWRGHAADCYSARKGTRRLPFQQR